MTAQIINGTEIARQIRAELEQEVAELKQKHNLVPGLATVLVGEDPASQIYVGLKERTSKALGIHSERYDLPAAATETELLGLIDRLNRDPSIHGILVQLPLPRHLNESKVIYAIDPKKDVDGIHPVNMGRLLLGDPDFLPCTPAGIQQLLIRSGVPIEGANVVVIGRSNTVSKPIANILLQKKRNANATVTVCHTGTRDIAFHTRQADILIVSMGRPKAVTADMVRDGAVVVDVGINRIGKAASGKDIIVGDVDFEAVKEIASAITPVPGGVGPMTIAMLMVNTVKAAKLASG
jgi:methylenetetrahydrofolate dehydrogenase (NADP+) / methenyltetrahydrofolate cyclohydrolase